MTSGETCHIQNAHHLESLEPLLPRYEPHDKHPIEPYFDKQRGEKVAPMPLDATEAQQLLLISLKKEGGDRRWAYHERRRKYYRFMRTHPKRSIYHGFEVDDDDEVPQTIKNQLNP
ncbi:MAG: hypothetical protein GY862_07040 [Gammaproteobacteria bacterium]|nr:hypothetical protein [Gammaproteobacteria bacterium]